MSVRNQEGKQRISETALVLLIKEKMAGIDGDQTNSPAKDDARIDTYDDDIRGRSDHLRNV
jgi:hypothetical protein